MPPFVKTLLFLIAGLWLSVWLFFVWAGIDQGLFDYRAYGDFWSRTGGSLAGFLLEIISTDLFYRPYKFVCFIYLGVINSPLWINLVALWAAIAAVELAFLGLSNKNVRHSILGLGLWLIAMWGVYDLGMTHT